MFIMVPPSGPMTARILIVGEAPGADEEARGAPFLGVAGMEMDRMLHEAGIMRSECFLTNVCRQRPLGNDINQFVAKTKKEVSLATKGTFIPFRDKMVKQPIIDGIKLLLLELETVKPNIVIAFGNLPMWVLTGRWGVMKHRASMLECDTDEIRKCLPR